jgi:hypothetical protein
MRSYEDSNEGQPLSCWNSKVTGQKEVRKQETVLSRLGRKGKRLRQRNRTQKASYVISKDRCLRSARLRRKAGRCFEDCEKRWE